MKNIFKLSIECVTGNAVFVAPHPDDVAIGSGAFAYSMHCLGVSSSMVLATDGSEARIPEMFLAEHGWAPSWSPQETERLRGRIRIDEAKREATILGMQKEVRVASDQHWFVEHMTPPQGMNIDRSIRDVKLFCPAPIDELSINGMRKALGDLNGALIFVTAPDDSLRMHRITTGLVAIIVAQQWTLGGGPAGLVFYEALSSSDSQQPLGQPVTVEFGEPVWSIVKSAIGVHASMAARRRVFGAYVNKNKTSYEALALEKNIATAQAIGSRWPYAQRARICTPEYSEALAKLADELLFKD
jgi:LmbE family N-acetylglucosaminyl deacetylase